MSDPNPAPLPDASPRPPAPERPSVPRWVGLVAALALLPAMVLWLRMVELSDRVQGLESQVRALRDGVQEQETARRQVARDCEEAQARRQQEVAATARAQAETRLLDLTWGLGETARAYRLATGGRADFAALRLQLLPLVEAARTSSGSSCVTADFCLGRLARLAGEADEARTALDRAIAVQPEFPAARCERIRVDLDAWLLRGIDRRIEAFERAAADTDPNLAWPRAAAATAASNAWLEDEVMRGLRATLVAAIPVFLEQAGRCPAGEGAHPLLQCAPEEVDLLRRVLQMFGADATDPRSGFDPLWRSPRVAEPASAAAVLLAIRRGAPASADLMELLARIPGGRTLAAVHAWAVRGRPGIAIVPSEGADPSALPADPDLRWRRLAVLAELAGRGASTSPDGTRGGVTPPSEAIAMRIERCQREGAPDRSTWLAWTRLHVGEARRMERAQEYGLEDQWLDALHAANHAAAGGDAPAVAAVMQADIHAQLARLIAAGGGNAESEFASAGTALDRAIDADPAWPGLRAARLALRVDAAESVAAQGRNPTGEAQAALTAAESLREDAATRSFAHQMAARALLAVAAYRLTQGEDPQAERDRAEAELSQALADRPDDVALIRWRARLFQLTAEARLARGESAADALSSAEADLLHAEQRAPGHGPTLASLGAVRVLRARTLPPESPEAVSAWRAVDLAFGAAEHVGALGPSARRARADARVALARDCIRAGQDPAEWMRGAIADLVAVRDAVGADPSIQLRLGLVRLEWSRAQLAQGSDAADLRLAALADFESVLAVQPEQSEAIAGRNEIQGGMTSTLLARAHREQRQGNFAEARQWFEQAVRAATAGDLAATPEGRRDLLVAHYDLACMVAQASVGCLTRDGARKPVTPEESASHRTTAFQHLEEAVRLGLHQAEQVADDPDLAPLRDDPRWEPLLQRMRE